MLWKLLYMHLSMRVFRMYLGAELLGHEVSLFWTSPGSGKLVPEVYMCILVTPHSLRQVLSEILLFAVWRVCNDISLFLMSFSLITKEAEYLSICSLLIWISSLGVLVQMLWLLFSWMAYLLQSVYTCTHPYKGEDTGPFPSICLQIIVWLPCGWFYCFLFLVC